NKYPRLLQPLGSVHDSCQRARCIELLSHGIFVGRGYGEKRCGRAKRGSSYKTNLEWRPALSRIINRPTSHFCVQQQTRAQLAIRIAIPKSKASGPEGADPARMDCQAPASLTP